MIVEQMASFSRELLHHLLCTGSPKRGRYISGPTPLFLFGQSDPQTFWSRSNNGYVHCFGILHSFLTFCQEASGIVNCLHDPDRKVDWAKKENSAKWSQMRNRGQRCSQRLLQLEKVLLKLCSWSMMSFSSWWYLYIIGRFCLFVTKNDHFT